MIHKPFEAEFDGVDGQAGGAVLRGVQTKSEQSWFVVDAHVFGPVDAMPGVRIYRDQA